MRYQYAGPGPDETGGELIRPGDVREFDTDPDGPWELLDAPQEVADEGDGDDPPDDPPPPPVTLFTPPATPEGM